MNDENNREFNDIETTASPAQEQREKKASKLERAGGKIQSVHALPASGPEILTKILKAYVIASKQGAEAIKYTDVAAVAALNPTMVSRNNAFLSESQFILPERWGYFKPNPATTDYAKQAPWDDQGAKAHIRSLIDRTWYGETVQQQFQLQDTLTKSQLIRAFGIKATPDESDANKLGLLVDFLVHFEYLVTDEQGNYISRPRDDSQVVDQPHKADAFIVEQLNPVETRPLLPESVEETGHATSHLHVNINLNLTPATSDEELELLITKVKTALSLLLERPK